MPTLVRVLSGVACAAALTLPATSVLALSVSVQSLSPGTTVEARHTVTFRIVPDSEAPFFTITDSFQGSSIRSDMINAGGNVSWTPLPSDAGVHTLTITARDINGQAANTTQTITVTPAPSLSVQSLSPGSQVMPGATVTFTLSAPGFVSPRFSLRDSFNNTKLTNENISAAGVFSWTPDITQNGDHALTLYATDLQGHDASTQLSLRVGAGPSLALNPASSTIIVAPFSPVRFAAVPVSYLPTGFSASDSFSGSSVSNANIDASGSFAWSPTLNDIGVHTITITGTVGSYGDRASVTQKVVVLKQDGTMPPDAAPAAPAAATTTATTAPAGTTAMAALLAQLAALQARLAELKGTPSPTASPVAVAATDKYIFKTFIGPGYSGTAVRKLQERLVELGYMTVKPNGYFGPATKAAVIKFQIAHDLDPRGHVGPGTRAALNE